MSTPLLAWYISGLLWLACFLASLITVAPGLESARDVATGIFFAGAVAFSILARFLRRLSPEHWLNQSWLFRGVMLSVAIGLTLLLKLGVIG